MGMQSFSYKTLIHSLEQGVTDLIFLYGFFNGTITKQKEIIKYLSPYLSHCTLSKIFFEKQNKNKEPLSMKITLPLTD